MPDHSLAHARSSLPADPPKRPDPAKPKPLRGHSKPLRGGGRKLDEGLAFLVVTGLLTFLAFDSAGYDLVARQETALVIWLLLAFGFGLGVLPRSRPGRAALIPAAGALGLVLWLALSLVWTESAERTSAELARLLGYVGLTALLLTAVNRRSFRAAAAGATVAALVVAAAALASRLFPDLFPGATDVARFFGLDRLDYPLDYWNAVGAWCAMAIGAGLAWSAHARPPAVRAIALGTLPIAGTALYLTYSRGGVIGAGVAVLAVLALSRNRWTVLLHSLAAAAGTAAAILTVRGHPEIADATGGGGGVVVALVVVLAGLGCAAVAILGRRLGVDGLRLPRRTAGYAAPAAIAVLVALTLVFARGPLSNAWDEFRNQQSATFGSDPAARLTSAGGNRNDVWGSAIDAFRAHPIDGTGAGTFEFWWSRDGRDPESVKDAHSLYLEALAELGLPGLVLLLTFLSGLALLALRARPALAAGTEIGASVAMSAVFAVFLVNAGLDWMWEETAVGALGLGAIAIAAAAGFDPEAGWRGRRSARRTGLRVAIVGFCVLAAAVEIPAVVATERVRASQSAAGEGDLASARSLAEDAVDAEPWAATPHLQLALVLEAEGDLPRARSELEDAISDEPTNWRYPLILARVEAAMGERRAAIATFRRGRALRPLSPAYSPFSPYGRAIYTPRQLEHLQRD